MRRIRLVFAGLALALLAAAGLLVQRAVAGVAAEREAQRSTLAARVFDEMERALSEFLAREEALASSEWLSTGRDEPSFVTARFELLPGGAVQLSPGSPPDLAPRLAGWSEERAARLGGPARGAPDAGRARDEGMLAKDQVAQAPAAPAPRPATSEAKESLYDALQSLNRGAEARAQRSRKLESMAEADGEASAPAEAQASADTSGKRDANGKPAAKPAPEPPARLAPASQAQPGAVRIAIDPLLGHRLDAQQLLLIRTLLVGERGYRQGLVLGADALGAWLRARALGSDTLGGATLSFSTDGAGAAAGGATVDYAHRFVEPFDALEATLALPPLPGSFGADTVLRLSLLLVAAGAAGLFALYRMVAVALQYTEQRSNFVAAVSHELKTPLTSIRMYGEMLRDGLVPTEAKRAEYYRTITAESERLSRLIDNVLEFARIERGAQPLAIRSGSLEAEVRTLCDALRPHAAESGFTLVLKAPDTLPAVRLDRDAVAQILVNLVDNALKYARSSTRREIGIVCERADGGVALRVRDHGPGVAPRELGRVFELFHRGESELTRTTRGTGLGLALVRSLAARMDARVSARNVESGGFEVSVVFPLAPTEIA